jgi:Na+-transporting NADH:ubiquinone oxidoreductase subunit NqrB
MNFLSCALALPSDPRYVQIALLGGLLGYGLLVLGLPVSLSAAATIVGLALITQLIATCRRGVVPFDPRSALISALSLCLLLQTESLVLAALAAVLAIASKFLIRYRGKHLFNPTNLAIVILLLITDSVWVSPGQWGHTTLAALALGCLGTVVTSRAKRADITFGFLASYAAILCTRALWLDDPMTLPWHAMQSGALLIFAFFMISDPKSTPDSRAGRLLFAFSTALTAAYFQFCWYESNALMYALACNALLVPAIDHILPAERFRWESPTNGLATLPIENTPTRFAHRPLGSDSIKL